jgi:hypothetical protein
MFEEILSDINKRMVNFTIDRIRSLGETESGAYPYYSALSKNQEMLNSVDLWLIDYIFEKYPEESKIHEIGCGAAQLGHALSSLGYNVIASEVDSRRFNFAFALGAHLNSGCKIVKANSFEVPGKFDLIVTKNAVAGGFVIDNDIRFYQKETQSGADCIINKMLYGDMSDPIPAIKKAGIEFEILEHNFILMRGRHVSA